MAYEPTIWKNREVERPRTFQEQSNPDGTITLIPKEGNIIEAGTPIIADTMNKMELGIKQAHDDLANLDLSELATKQELNTHSVDGAAHGIGNKATLQTNHKTTLVGAINEAFQSANDGKTAIASAVTNKGVPASPTDTFPTLASKIGQISTGKKWASGTIKPGGSISCFRPDGTPVTWVRTQVTGLDFTPKVIVTYVADIPAFMVNMDAPLLNGYVIATVFNAERVRVGQGGVEVTYGGFSIPSSNDIDRIWVAFE